MKQFRDDYAQMLGYKNYIELVDDSSNLEIEFHTDNLMKMVKNQTPNYSHAC